MSLPDFCPSTVPPGASSELIKLYACKDASNCFLDIQQKNNANTIYNDIQNKKLADSIALYKQNLASYQAKLDSWTKRIGEFSKFAKYDGKSNDFWATDTDGTCWWGEKWNEGHNWCHDKANQKGYDGENYWAKEWGNCYGRWGNFKCQKDPNVVQTQQAEYQAVKPIFTEKEPTRDDFPLKQITPIDNLNIQCCSNYLSGNATVTGNEQVCSQSIEQKIIEMTGAPSANRPPTIVPVPISAIPSAPETNNSSLMLIIIAIIIISMSSSVILLFQFR